MKHAVKNQYQAFYQQRRKARLRGVDFRFTYDEWMCWWFDQLGVDWPCLRGRGKGKYVMARNGDTGPYHPDNVRCLLYEQNTIDAWFNAGFRKKGIKLTEADVRTIRAMKGLQKDIAQKFNITATMVSHIQRGKHWGYIK